MNINWVDLPFGYNIYEMMTEYPYTVRNKQNNHVYKVQLNRGLYLVEICGSKYYLHKLLCDIKLKDDDDYQRLVNVNAPEKVLNWYKKDLLKTMRNKVREDFNEHRDSE